MSFPKIRTPYLLLLPGFAFLFTFFILPIVNLAQTSTQTPVAGGDTGEYEQTLAFGNYIQAFVENKEQFGRSFLYASLATVFALAIAYPLAYAIAFKSGKFKNILLVLVVAPFFTSFLLRTIAWKQILGEEGFISVVVAIDSQSGKIVAGPDIHARGFTEDKTLFDDVKGDIEKALSKAVAGGFNGTHQLSQVVRKTIGLLRDSATTFRTTCHALLHA